MEKATNEFKIIEKEKLELNTDKNLMFSPNTENIIKEPSEEANITNCLAMTVKKDYNLTIVKNVFTTTGRLSWKIALVTAIINILNMLF